MRKYLLLVLFIPLALKAKEKPKLYLTGGYFIDAPRMTRATVQSVQPYNSVQTTMVLSKARDKGYFAGLGLSVGFPHTPFSLLLEGCFERHQLEADGYLRAYSGTGRYDYPFGMIDISSYADVGLGLAYNLFSNRHLSYAVDLGIYQKLLIAERGRFDNEYTTGRLGLRAGSSVLQLTLNYEYGFTGMYKSQVDVGLVSGDFWQVKSSRLSLGLAIAPVPLVRGCGKAYRWLFKQ